jgi:hypothetical protein
MNEEKTQIVLFATQGNETILPSSTSSIAIANFLGLIIDNHLNWVPHIEALLVKLARATFAIRTLARECDRAVVRSVYFAQIQSIKQYGVIFWGGVHQAIRVFRAQKRAVRTMVSIGHRKSCRPKFRELNILPLPSIYILSVCQFVRDNFGLFQDG